MHVTEVPCLMGIGNFEPFDDVKLGKLSIFLKQFVGQLQSEESVETKCR